ncbi:uncharacterized protein LOC117642762 [Thrips palmi]|uniref:Uncharacterized protein LOC117642762 n=1 Tax=Thrips palmi TaxID=161013 RepID=A0A6P8ZKI8_THRPL|nr:uncharacterized protein LOC117642762 [Thrips palmi]
MAETSPQGFKTKLDRFEVTFSYDKVFRWNLHFAPAILSVLPATMASDGSNCEDVFVVIETPRDFCVVEEDSVIFSEPLSLGDKVKFNWSKTQRLEGIVRFISVNADLCHEEARRLHRLSRKTRNSGSFHENSPRKCRGRDPAQSLLKSQSLPKKPSKDLKPARITERELLKNFSYQRGRNMIVSDGSDVESNEDDVVVETTEVDSVSSMKSSESNQDLLSKLMMRFDSEMLSKLADGKTSLEDLASGRSASSASGGSSQPLSSCNSFRTSDSVARPSANSTPLTSSSYTKKKLFRFHRVIGKVEPFAGQQYLFPEAPLDPNEAVQLYENSGVYCCALQFSRAESGSSATMVARRLVEGVFTREALLSSSVSGLPPRGKGKAAYAGQGATAVKPFLDPKGINAIVCQSLIFQKKKHFMRKKDETQIRQSIAVRLNELQRLGNAENSENNL